MPEIQVNKDIILHYEEHGKGFPLLLIHGLLSDLTSWKYQITPFSERYHVIAMDLKGHGRS